MLGVLDYGLGERQRDYHELDGRKYALCRHPIKVSTYSGSPSPDGSNTVVGPESASEKSVSRAGCVDRIMNTTCKSHVSGSLVR